MNSALVIFQLVALWPVWRWWAHRADGEAALMALLCAAVLAALGALRPSTAVRPRWFLPASAMVLYAATFHLLPPLGRALLAGLALGFTASEALHRRRAQPGTLALCVLALPWLETADFLAGGTLRALAAHGAALALRWVGDDVTLDGACLRGAWGSACVDPPCAGIRMVWMSAWLVAALSAWRGFGWTRTAALGACALCAVLVGNVLRTASLYVAETRVTLPAWAHEGVGVAAFALVLGAVVSMALVLEQGGWTCAERSSSPRPA